jgi:hypothetical protein
MEILGGLGLMLVFLLALGGAYLKGQQREREKQARRDDATEDLIRDKRDELSRISDEELDERARKWM